MTGFVAATASNNKARSSFRRDSYLPLRCLNYWLACIVNLRHAFAGIKGYAWYVRQWRAYRRLPGAERLRLVDSMPQVHDRSDTTPFDSHYFYVNAWAMRRIVASGRKRHIDIGSAIALPSLLAAVLPVYFVDYRPLDAPCAGMTSIAGDLLGLPFATDSVESLSCLHVAEHVGLGRYGDRLDAQGTQKAAAELARVLAPGGHLYFALPVGTPRTCFNAHRIHRAETIAEYFPGLELVGFSGVHDDGHFVEDIRLNEFYRDRYACGMFHFRKPQGSPVGTHLC